jgi:teichuronic acid exporter
LSNKRIFLVNSSLNLLFSPLRFILNLYLASLLSPKDYGLMVIPTLIISISEFLIDSGFRTSLIQKGSLNIKHSSSIFIFNFIISLIICSLLIFISSSIFNFQIFIEIRFLILVSSFILLIKSFSMIPEARMQIKSEFGFLLFFEFLSNIIAYVITIMYTNYYDKQYSLILLFFISTFSYTFFILFKEKFFPKLKFYSTKIIFYHWRAGKKLLLQGMLELFSDKVDELTMIKFINTINLGFYTKGKELSNTIGVVGSKFFSRPWFTIMSKFSNNKLYFKQKYLLANYLLLIVVSTILILSNYLGVFFINYFLGKKWTGLIDYYKYFTLFSTLYFLVVFNKYTILALGLFKNNLTVEKYYVLLKIIFILFYIFIAYKYNLDNIKFIIFIITLDLLSKLLMLLLQLKLLTKVLELKSNILIFNLLLLFILFILFIYGNNYIFLLFTFIFIIIFIINFYKLYYTYSVKSSY